MNPITKTALFDRLPPAWPDDLLPAIREQVHHSQRRVVVLDDDPTGTQTVHGLPVLTEWSVDSLKTALQEDDPPCFYILTNSRSLPLAEAQALNTTIGTHLKQAAAATGTKLAIVSRSDSTLRGHFPGEVDALAAALGDAFDAWLLCPFFLEGGRYTINDIHYVAEDDHLIPAAETPYAQDASFGYAYSNLRDWVTEKTGGRIAPAQIDSISLDDIRQGGPPRITERLLALPPGSVCAINAASYRDLDVFVLGLLAAEAEGWRYIYRTAASFVRVRAGIAPRALLTAGELKLPSRGGGLFVVGSYVPKTTSQVNALIQQTDVLPLEMDVPALLDDTTRPAAIRRIANQANAALSIGRDAVIFTSRDVVTGDDVESSLAIGQSVSDALIAIMRAIETQPRYLVAKGGITSSDVATKGLNVRRAEVMGQILPGVPVWKLGPESRYPGAAYVVFPGNVGDANSLCAIYDAFTEDPC
jgi:uncharacterized protein YgbK (DUF1537 family)